MKTLNIVNMLVVAAIGVTISILAGNVAWCYYIVGVIVGGLSYSLYTPIK